MRSTKTRTGSARKHTFFAAPLLSSLLHCCRPTPCILYLYRLFCTAISLHYHFEISILPAHEWMAENTWNSLHRTFFHVTNSRWRCLVALRCERKCIGTSRTKIAFTTNRCCCYCCCCIPWWCDVSRDTVHRCWCIRSSHSQTVSAYFLARFSFSFASTQSILTGAKSVKHRSLNLFRATSQCHSMWLHFANKKSIQSQII